MKFSSSFLFLGCWLTGQWWIVTGKVYPKPTIQVRPSSVVAFGGSFTIYCNGGGSPYERYSLHQQRNESWNKLIIRKQNTTMGVYFKHNAKTPDAGVYKCAYCFCPSEFSEICSQDSNTIDVLIRDPSLWKPSIALSGMPVVNENATIECKAPENDDLNFTLHRFSDLISMRHSDTETVKFPFPLLKVADAGRYTCEYRRRRNPFVLSETSEPLDLNLTDSSLSKPTIELRPKEYVALSWSVTIECWGPERGLNFTLQQPSNSTALWLSQSTANTTKFFVARVRLEDTGNYTCRYHRRDNPFIWSEPSDPVLLNVRAISTVEACVRLVVAILVFLATLLIAAEAVYSSKKEAALRSLETE